MIALAVLAAGAANIGTCVHLPPNDTLDLAVELGGAWVRIDLNWDLVQPAEGEWNWAPIDSVVDAAVARGLEVYATMGYSPAWASTGDRRGDGASNDVPVAAAYRAFVEAAVDRYKTKIAAFGTWNEPNLADFFEGTRQEWIDHVYRPAVQGIRARCASCVVAGPEVATIGDQYDDYIIAALGAELPTILSAHIYAGFPEDDAQAGITKDSFYNKLDAHRVIGPYAGPLSIRESAISAGQMNLPIWITEVGRQAPIGDAGALAAQTTFVRRVLDAMETRPWWAGTLFYELSEEHPGGMWPDIHWGLALRVADPDPSPLDNFERKPAYDYLKARLAAAPMPGGDAGLDAGGGGNPAGPDAGIDDPSMGGAPAGCGCATSGTRSGALTWLLGLLALIGRRRRRA